MGALQAAKAGLIAPLLVGPRAKILAVADAAGLVVDEIWIIDAPHSHASAEVVVVEVQAGRDVALMKGKLHTDELLAAVLSRSVGLRTERRPSDIFTLDVPDHPHLLHITAAAITIAPDLPALADIVQNALELVHAQGRTARAPHFCQRWKS
jgi:phosphate acetyltransferase/phosphate butyryltransferase